MALQLFTRRTASLPKCIFRHTGHERHAQLLRHLRPFSTTPSTFQILGLWRNTNRAADVPIGSVRKITPRRRGLYKNDHKGIKVYQSPPSAWRRCKFPVQTITNTQLEHLDPSGKRARLFDKRNLEAAKVGDILLVRQKSGDPFAGVCLNIRRRGVDTSILLRNSLTRVGVEMWYKVFSPNVEGIEIVQRRERRARRARLYYMRQPKHDIGSVDNIVRQYQRQRQVLLSGGEVKARDANAHKKKPKRK